MLMESSDLIELLAVNTRRFRSRMTDAGFTLGVSQRVIDIPHTYTSALYTSIRCYVGDGVLSCVFRVMTFILLHL